MKDTITLLGVLMLLAACPVEAWSTLAKKMEAFENVCARADIYGCYVNHKYGYALA